MAMALRSASEAKALNSVYTLGYQINAIQLDGIHCYCNRGYSIVFTQSFSFRHGYFIIKQGIHLPPAVYAVFVVVIESINIGNHFSERLQS